MSEGDPLAEFDRWCAGVWSPELTVREWWRALAESGWAFPTWPTEWYGHGLSDLEGILVHERMADLEVLGPPVGAGPMMGAKVLLEYGTEEQKRRWLLPLASGEENWCQFFSEPGAGSDLASVQTRAERHGDQWVVNGQKVWNSRTLIAERGLLVTRTDFSGPKHKGLTYFVIDVDQPGIDIRPIKQMNGRSEFNETFFTDAVVGDESRLGDVGAGFAVALATLSAERTNFAAGGHGRLRSAVSGPLGGQMDRRVGDVLEDPEQEDVSGANALAYNDAASLVTLARRYGKLGDPAIRQGIARVHAVSEGMRFTSLRVRSALAAGRELGSESSVGYVKGVRLVRLIRDLCGQIAGPASLVEGPDGGDDDVLMSILTAPCHGIQGGSEQIQLNIIGERILGLPRDPAR